jgi:hypothetical protein
VVVVPVWFWCLVGLRSLVVRWCGVVVLAVVVGGLGACAICVVCGLTGWCSWCGFVGRVCIGGAVRLDGWPYG